MTILDKDLARESTNKIGDREIQVTLTADQKISFKLKGMKSGEVSIGIDELYNKLAGIETTVSEVVKEKPKEVVKKKRPDNDPMISLYELRASTLVTKMDYGMKVEFEKIICDLIEDKIK